MTHTLSKLADELRSAIQLLCRVCCFGLPLYNTNAREAPIARSGLLHFWWRLKVDVAGRRQTPLSTATLNMFVPCVIRWRMIDD